jgi:hypothetical protein
MRRGERRQVKGRQGFLAGRLDASETTLLASVLKFVEGCVHQERRRQKRGMMRLPSGGSRQGVARPPRAGSGECEN